VLLQGVLWLYFVVELVQTLLEREVRRQMAWSKCASLALYPEGRASAAPTAELVFGVLEGPRRHACSMSGARSYDASTTR
jgi:hypothetical protein